MNEKNKEIAVLENVNNMLDLKAEDVPVIISEQFDMIKDLDAKIQDAQKQAESAKSMAQSAKNVSAKRGFIHDYKRDAIEATQKAVEGNANALGEVVEAQKLQFEFQTKLTEITKYLFAMGATNIAMNRSVVRELELKLKGASKKKLSELAKSEVLGVVKQLKAQEDIMIKQENLEKAVKDHSKKLATQEEVIKKQAELDKAIKEYDEKFASKDIKDAEQDKQISDIESLNKKQSIEQAKRDQQQDELLKKQIDTGKRHDKQISKINKENKGFEEELKILESSFQVLEDKYNILAKKIWLSKVSISLSIIAIAIAIATILK